MKEFAINCHNDVCDTIGPTGSDLWVEEGDCEIQLDIKAKRSRSTMIWGYVIDCWNRPLEDVTVTLFRYCFGRRLENLCHTQTDADGYYQFDLPFECKGKYRVIANKCNCMKERMPKENGHCNSYEEAEEPCVQNYDRKQNNIRYY